MVTALPMAFIISSCSDNRKDIALSLLFPNPGAFNEENDEAISAALSARFGAGSSTARLIHFVESLGGGCGRGIQVANEEYYDLICRIPEYEVFGFAMSLIIEAQTNGSMEPDVKKIKGRSVSFSL